MRVSGFSHLIWWSGLFGIFIVIGVNRVTGAPANDESQHPTPSPSSSYVPPAPQVTSKRGQSACLVNESAIEDIRKAKEDLEKAKKSIEAKEAELRAREKAIVEELKKLEQTREVISKVQELKKAEEQQKVAKLVETFLTMSPKASAKVLSALDDGLAVAVISQMETVRLAKIMNVMDPIRSSNLSELMTGVHKVRSSAPKLGHLPGPTFTKSEVSSGDGMNVTASLKGGEKNVGNSNASIGRESADQQYRAPSEKAQKSN